MKLQAINATLSEQRLFDLVPDSLFIHERGLYRALQESEGDANNDLCLAQRLGTLFDNGEIRLGQVYAKVLLASDLTVTALSLTFDEA